jgi:GT2 family glycosyltransferase
MARVAINVVTYNSAASIDSCLTSVFLQDYRDFEVTVIDNNSQDGTQEKLARWKQQGVHVIFNRTNQYYSRAHNFAIRETDSAFLLTLNPDVIIHPHFVRQALLAFEVSPQIGSVNGKLLLLPAPQETAEVLESEPPESALIDSGGLMMYKSRRPFLRGNRRPHGESCLFPEYIFGADGACAAYRRTMLEDTAVEGEYFDNDFVIYREDVDLAWRGQLFGWDSYYTPDALGYHARGFHPGYKRRSIARHLRRQSVKNGWLLLVKNDTRESLLRDFMHVGRYQLKVVAGVLSIEPSSLAAVPDLIKLMPAMQHKRDHIQAKRRRSEIELWQWFE